MLRDPRAALLVPAAAAVALLTLSACSSSGGSNASTASKAAASTAGGASSSSGAKPSGSTVKIGIIAPVGAAVSYPDMIAAAKGAARGINTRGGIAGHPVAIDFCNEDLNPNKATACARKMVSDHVIATAGDFTISAEQQVLQILGAAGIASVGTYPFTPAGGTAKNSYLLLGGLTYINAAQIDYAIKGGGKKVAIARVDLPQTAGYESFERKAITQLGGSLTTSVSVPQTSTDVSPQAAAVVNSKPDVVNFNMGDNLMVPMMNAMSQLGYRGKYIQADDALTEKEINGLSASVRSQVLFVGPFPPVSAAPQFPGLKQFRTDMKAEAASGDKDTPTSQTYVRDGVMNAYAATIAVGKIANAAKARDAASFSTAIDAAKSVDLGGIVPAWNPNTSVSKTVPRASDGSFFYFSWTNGKPTLASTKPTDVTAIVDSDS